MISKKVLGFALCVGLIGTTVGCTRVQQGAAAGGLLGAGLGYAWSANYGESSRNVQSALIGGAGGAAVGALAGDAWRETEDDDYDRDDRNYETTTTTTDGRRVGATDRTIRTEERYIYEREGVPANRTDTRIDTRTNSRLDNNRSGAGVEGGARIMETETRTNREMRTGERPITNSTTTTREIDRRTTTTDNAIDTRTEEQRRLDNERDGASN